MSPDQTTSKTKFKISAMRICRVRSLPVIVFVVGSISLAILAFNASRNAIPDLLVNITEFVADPIDDSGLLVPNIVHMLHYGTPDLTFFEVVTLKAAHLHQKPSNIYIHCECQKLEGKYWNMVKDIPGLELRFKKQPTHVFGKKLSQVFHASDIARIEVMMEHGGIYIDTDTYIVSSLEEFRKYEFTVGWPDDGNIGTQILVAHKNARFLKLWLNSYKFYQPDLWYYNAGVLPTEHILRRMPSLVHRVPRDFGVDYLYIREMMYERETDEWKTYKTIHYLIRHQPKDNSIDFNEENIKTYKKTFGSMARLVFYGTTDLIT